MSYVTCPHCGVELTVYENDYMPGCREMEDVICPNCKKVADAILKIDFGASSTPNWLVSEQMKMYQALVAGEGK